MLLYKKIISVNEFLGKEADGEKEWLDKWKNYDKNISPLSFRIFSRFIGPDINILPLELCAGLIEPILTPRSFRDVYSDKNEFDLIIPDVLPTTFLRNISGRFYSRDYNIILDVDKFLQDINCEKIILKPTRTSSGIGVVIFYKLGVHFYNSKGLKLDKNYLDLLYKKNYIIQEYFEQSDFTAQFNLSSVNTIRVSTYRDSNGEINVLRSIMRIGSNGSEVDNAHAGGVFCGVDDKGKIGSYVCDQFGSTAIVFNNINFSENVFFVPNFDSIKNMVKDIHKKIIHHDLIAFDVVLDKNNMPKLLEINVGGFGGWAFQFTSGTIFREYTDDVMTYCLNRYKKYKKSKDINDLIM